MALAEAVLKHDPQEGNRATVSILSRAGHREDELVAEMSRSIAVATGRTVVVCSGIHLEIGTPVASVNMISSGRVQNKMPGEFVIMVDKRTLPGEIK